MCGTTALAHSHEPRTLTAIALSNSSTVISQNGPFHTVMKYAALLIRISTPPNCFTVSSTIALTLFSFETSQAMLIAFPPMSLIALTM